MYLRLAIFATSSHSLCSSARQLLLHSLSVLAREKERGTNISSSLPAARQRAGLAEDCAFFGKGNILISKDTNYT
jgi:hypothetical protein